MSEKVIIVILVLGVIGGLFHLLDMATELIGDIHRLYKNWRKR